MLLIIVFCFLSTVRGHTVEDGSKTLFEDSNTQPYDCMNQTLVPPNCHLEPLITAAFKESIDIMNGEYSFVNRLSERLILKKNTQCYKIFSNIEKIISSTTNAIYMQADKNFSYKDSIEHRLLCLSAIIQIFPMKVKSLYQTFLLLIKSKTSNLNLSNDSSRIIAKCTIEPVEGGGRLYASSSRLEDNVQRPVYIGSNTGSESQWLQELVGIEDYFRLKNVKYNEYLRSFNPWVGSAALAVTSAQSAGDSRFFWYQPENESPSNFRLTHANTQGNLIAQSGYPSKVALVSISRSAYWKLVCQY